MTYKFESFSHPSEEREGDTSDATLTYDQEDSELTVDYEEEGVVKEEKTEKVTTHHKESEKEMVGTKRKMAEEDSEPPPDAKRTLSCAKSGTNMALKESENKEKVKEGKEKKADESGSVGAAAVKPSLEKKDSMEENLICQICQVCVCQCLD